MLIYVAGSYSNGDVARNVKRAIDIADQLLEKGYIPYVPHLTHFWHIISPKPWDTWMKIDLEILRRCDGIFMMNGFRNSEGAKIELELAKSLGLEVMFEDDKIEGL